MSEHGMTVEEYLGTQYKAFRLEERRRLHAAYYTEAFQESLADFLQRKTRVKGAAGADMPAWIEELAEVGAKSVPAIKPRRKNLRGPSRKSTKAEQAVIDHYLNCPPLVKS